MSNRGNYLEAIFSRKFHKHHTPILISSVILRQFGAGQVDIAIMEKKENYNEITLFEVKSSINISKKQILRLKRSAKIVSELLNCGINLKLIIPEKTFCQNDKAFLSYYL